VVADSCLDKIFLAIHVVIGKRESHICFPRAISEFMAVYANSLLAILLTRNQLRESRRSIPLLSSDFENKRSPRSPNRVTFLSSVSTSPIFRNEIGITLANYLVIAPQVLRPYFCEVNHCESMRLFTVSVGPYNNNGCSYK
jgi:hypothetical protein